MQGGANGTSSIREIDDTDSSLTFNGAGRFTMWNNPAITGSTGNELRMLNGEVSFGEFWANGGTDARVNIFNGVFKADALVADQANAVVTMMAGGTGAFNVGDMISTATMDQMLINFETGSLASFTIGNIAGATTQDYWETKIEDGKVQVDGVAKTGTTRFVIADAGALGTTITLNPNPLNYYDGSGDLTSAANWDLDLPTNANPGLVSTTDGPQDFGAQPWMYSFQVSQTGGSITDTADVGIALRGGAQNTTDNCTFVIDDASNTDFSSTNLAISGQLTLWNRYTGTGSTGNTFSVLNGYADVAILAATSTANSTVNILNGKLDVGYFSNARVTVNMLAGGTGQFNLADMSGTEEAKSKLDQMILNFETGSLASFTIDADDDGSAVGAWETKIAAGQVKVDGAANTALSNFVITQNGDAETISLLPTLIINSDDLTLGDIDGTVTAIFAADSSGSLTLGDLNGGTVDVSFGSGSSSSVVLADYVSGTILVNFEPGSEASFTIGSKQGGTSGGLWEWWINNTDRISIGGVPSNDVSDFVIVWDGGTSTTISLAPTTPALPVIDSASLDGSGNFVVQVSGLVIGTEYFLKKTTDLSDGAVFDVVAASVTATSTTETLTDTDAESDQAFYQVTD